MEIAEQNQQQQVIDLITSSLHERYSPGSDEEEIDHKATLLSLAAESSPSFDRFQGKSPSLTKTGSTVHYKEVQIDSYSL